MSDEKMRKVTISYQAMTDVSAFVLEALRQGCGAAGLDDEQALLVLQWTLGAALYASGCDPAMRHTPLSEALPGVAQGWSDAEKAADIDWGHAS